MAKYKTVELLSMNDYIANHCREIFVAGLNEMIRSNTLSEAVQEMVMNEAFGPDDIKFFPRARHYYWFQSRYAVLADVPFELRCMVWDNGRTESRMLSLSARLDVYADPEETGPEYAELPAFHCEFIGVEMETGKHDRFLRPMSQYLIPLDSNPMIDAYAEKMWRKYIPGYIEENAVLNYTKISDALGLRIVEMNVHDCRLSSILFYEKGRLPVRTTEIVDGKEVESKPKVIDIEANTIVLNQSVLRDHRRELAVLHECWHHENHYMAFRLQRLGSSDPRAWKTVEIDDERYDPKKDAALKAVRCMEYQAMRGSYALMLPASITKPMIEMLYEERRSFRHAYGMRCHDGLLYEDVGKAVAERMHVRNGHVRTRMIQLEKYEAKGALNYMVERGAYIEPFAYAPESCPANCYTFVIMPDELHELFMRDKALRELLETGDYVYVDGHVCRNEPELMHMVDGVLKLVDEANEHVDRYCLRFKTEYEQNLNVSEGFYSVNCDENYSRHYNEIICYAGQMTEEERNSLKEQIIYGMPYRTNEAIIYLMNGGITNEQKAADVKPVLKEWSVEALAEEMDTTDRKILRMRNDQYLNYKKEDLIMFCLGMHLPPWISFVFLEKCGIRLSYYGIDLEYRELLSLYFMDQGVELMEKMGNLAEKYKNK